MSQWGATQHLSRVPAAQVTVTNPGERGLIPAQPYWPPTTPTIRPFPNPPAPTSSKHSRAHLNKVESGVRVQDHGYRKAPAGASQPLPTVVLNALRQLEAHFHPPLVEVSVDKTDKSVGVGRNFSEGSATQPSVTTGGHQASIGSSNVTLKQTLGLHRTPTTAVKDLLLLINTSSSEKELSARANSVTSQVQPWREEIRQTTVTVQSPFTNHVHSQTPEVSQDYDHRNFREGNHTLGQQSFRVQLISDEVAKEPSAAITTVRPDSGIIPNAEHNNPVPPRKHSGNFPQVHNLVRPSNLSVLGKAPHHDNQVPATLPEGPQRSNLNSHSVQQSRFNTKHTNGQISQHPKTKTDDFPQQGAAVPTHFPRVLLRPQGGYLPTQHHGTPQPDITNSSHSPAASKLQITNPRRPISTSLLPVSFHQNPFTVSQQSVPTTNPASLPHQQLSRPAMLHQEIPHLIHPLHLPGHYHRQISTSPQFKNASQNLSQQIKVVPHRSIHPEEKVTSSQGHNNNRQINKNHNLPLQQQTRDSSHTDPFGEVFELLNKKISKDERTRNYHHNDYYYYYDYDDYYYDYEYYEDNPDTTESDRPPPKPSIPTTHHKHATTAPTSPKRFPGIPSAHSLPGTTPAPPPLRPRYRQPITLPSSFIPPRPGRPRTNHAPKAKDPELPPEEGLQLQPHGLLKDRSYFSSLLAPHHRPWHVANSNIPSTHPSFLDQEPPYTVQGFPNIRREPFLTHHPKNVENSFPSSSTRNRSSAKFISQEESSTVIPLSTLTTPASLHTTASPAMTKPLSDSTETPTHTRTPMLTTKAPMSDATSTKSEESEATASAAGESAAAAFPHTSTRHRPPLAVELGTFLGKGRHLTVLVSPEHLLRLSKSRQETREEKHRTPVYFAPPEAGQQRTPRRATPGLYKSRTRRRRRPKNYNDENNQRSHGPSHLLPSPTPRGTSESLHNYSLEQEPQSETLMVNDTSDWRLSTKLTQTAKSHRIPLLPQVFLPDYSNTSQRSIRKNIYQGSFSHPIYKEYNADLYLDPMGATATTGNSTNMLHPHTEPDATSSQPAAPEETSGQRRKHSHDPTVTSSSRPKKENEALAGHHTPQPPPAPLTRLAPRPTLSTLTDHRNVSKRKSFTRLPLLGLTGEQALTTYGMEQTAEVLAPDQQSWKRPSAPSSHSEGRL